MLPGTELKSTTPQRKAGLAGKQNANNQRTKALFMFLLPYYMAGAH
jgi:hypothetical protein